MIKGMLKPVVTRTQIAGEALAVRIVRIIKEESGQDLVEYALVVALIAFGAAAGMKALGTGVNTMFSHISTTLAAE
jgi:pilus assembly protein Flp/PilA